MRKLSAYRESAHERNPLSINQWGTSDPFSPSTADILTECTGTEAAFSNRFSAIFDPSAKADRFLTEGNWVNSVVPIYPLFVMRSCVRTITRSLFWGEAGGRCETAIVSLNFFEELLVSSTYFFPFLGIHSNTMTIISRCIPGIFNWQLGRN